MERLTKRTSIGVLVKEDYGEKALKTLYSCNGGKPNPHYTNCDKGYCAMEKLADYEDAEEQGRILPAPLDGVERFSLDGGKTTWQRVYETDMTEEGTAMTENKAIERIKKYACNNRCIPQLCNDGCMYGDTKCAFFVAIKALEEVQQYRALGTPEDLKAMKEHGAFTGTELAQLAAMQMRLKEYERIGTPEELQDMKNNYFEALSDWRQYRKIGTLEECRAAMTVKKEVQEIVNQQLIAGKNNYKETYDCFWKITKVVQANY